ncbi:hypothetical protein [Actinomadura atramentaria]|uniref:hypothetical protein n=1 Tax=Actinomadura atramentaria TaxID=1990 RepID=UPI000365A570|nr:hypothetical protein [Actinomadura atramentaria]
MEPYSLVVRRGRLGYADETPVDRDRDGILWMRMSVSPGQGRPVLGELHVLRQRRAMRKLLCQVCAVPCGEDAVWLQSAEEYAVGPWPESIITAHPPLCLGCARRAVEVCPHLRDGHVAVRATRAVLHGVFGVLCVPGLGGAFIKDTATLAFGDSRLRWVQAGQLLMRLVDYRVVSLG